MYQVIVLALLLAGIPSGFITFRIMGMRMAPHFGVLILAIIATGLNLVTGGGNFIYPAVALQLLAGISAYTQFFPVLRDNFQAAPLYACHLSTMTTAAVLAAASLLA
ncbi:DUF5400 domain-containing protein [Methanothermobacter sp.]|uniref:DUF5400 domain-containing protein n=1 Tax=Methanothermobacter sp. TaxID=1884223 RepID=UPI002639FC37|nr:DUF5400 domain-containing protein [Methanothermobacter sp.]MDI9617822.1 DUF5400 domain-containing protein [Methanothermobacter sp.]